MTGDPSLLPEDIRDPDAPPPEFVQAMEEKAAHHVDALNEQAKQAGIGLPHPLHDKATYEEYHGPVTGLDEHYLAAERERLAAPFRHMTRQDAEAITEQQQFADSLWEDWAASEYGQDGYSPQEVKEAAGRVVRRYYAEGSRDIRRRISQRKGRFFEDVSVELAVGPEPNSEGGQRTAGLDYSGTGRAARGEPEEKPSNLSDELASDQRKSGYW